MTLNPETVVIGILAALLTATSGIIIALIAAKTNREANAVNFSRTLLERVDALDTKVSTLEGKLTTSERALQAAVRFIDRLVHWGRTGGGDDLPSVPEELHDYLDRDLWKLPRVDAD